MLKNTYYKVLKKIIPIIILCIINACNNKPKESILPATNETDSVVIFMQSISKGVSDKGPVAWLSYFEDSPDFLMAADGSVAFHSYDSAKSFITTILIKSISKISLNWKEVHIDNIETGIASVAADFQEVLTETSGKNNLVNGYFTATARHTQQGWKLRNAHWSMIPGK